ncbi:MAG: TonB-dependent receptor [Melioribacter sp.]|nr:TonB-dependent receptor [Melioribacter sp.]
MKKLFCSIILFVSFLNLFSQQEQSKKKLLSGNVNDTTKAKIISTEVDSTKPVIKEKLIPLTQIKRLSSSGNTLNSDKLQKLDSRYTGDYFSYIPFGFVRDFGSIGQPNEVVIYGNGFGNSSFLMNGININNRLTNSLDLNLFQSESIDSIEIIPLAQGFLYSEMNNPVSVNFISRDFITSKPLTRIRFYQAPNEEGFFDGIFSSNISRRFSVYTELTHQSTDPRFKNSDYGMWAGSVRLRYLLNNDLNIIGSYSYYQSNVGLNGGVDLDSIKREFPANQTEEILFSTIQAPVNYPDRYQKVSSNNLNIKLLGNIIGNTPTDLTFYYQLSLVEYRQNEFTSLKRDTWRWDWPLRYDKITNDNKFITYGAKLSQKFETDLFNIYSEAFYESTLLNTPLIKRNDRINTFSAMAKASFQQQSGKQKFIPSVFGKFLNYDGNSYLGAGADLSWSIDESFSCYFGLSKFKRPPNQLSNLTGLNDKSDISIIEAKLNYKNSAIGISSGYFFQELAINGRTRKSLQGINFRLDWNLWKLLVSTSSNYYFIQENKDNFPLPDFTSSGGIYYVDTLFNSNLKLKAGINYHLIGNRGYQIFNFETFEIARWIRTGGAVPPTAEVNPSIQFDFFLAGKIQDAATIYFVFENLLNERYYIVPYYPKQERGIRLGVSWEFLD